MSADQIYSLTLLAALLAAGLSAVGALGLLWRRRSRRLGAVAWIAGLTAMAFGLLSLTVHLAFGHRPGTTEVLGLVAFFEAHPAYLIVFVIVRLAAVAGRRFRSNRS